jgi:hypothetical protein
MKHQKSARVKIIKDNIQKGEKIPNTTKDCEIGQHFDKELEKRGHVIDPTGIVDCPEYGIDNKSRKHGSKCPHTVGSMTKKDIKNTPNWIDTRFYKKSLNQNQITYSDIFKEVVDVTILDMDLPEIQSELEAAYIDLRNQLLLGDESKNIISANGWALFDGYNHSNSYRFRITNKAMGYIKNLSKSRDTRNKLFYEEA